MQPASHFTSPFHEVVGRFIIYLVELFMAGRVTAVTRGTLFPWRGHPQSVFRPAPLTYGNIDKDQLRNPGSEDWTGDAFLMAGRRECLAATTLKVSANWFSWFVMS